jgi:hypothetical protein
MLEKKIFQVFINNSIEEMPVIIKSIDESSSKWLNIKKSKMIV